MSQFSACTFDWNGRSSLNFNLLLLEFGTAQGLETNSAGSSVSLISDSVNRRSEQLVYGVTQDEPMSFQITIGSDQPKNRAEIDKILAWLIQGRPSSLYINQDDMVFYRYIGVFSDPQLVSVAKKPFGLTLTFNSISPYGYTFPLSKTLTVSGTLRYAFHNESGDFDYLYPTITITPRVNVNTFSIVNQSDGNREFRFLFTSPLPNGTEAITVNNKLQIIQSSLGNDYSRRRFAGFNLRWLRLRPGVNNLVISGNSTVKIDYSFAKRIGA